MEQECQAQVDKMNERMPVSGSECGVRVLIVFWRDVEASYWQF